jgi:F-box/leucine-rich repeat protein 5
MKSEKTIYLKHLKLRFIIEFISRFTVNALVRIGEGVQRLVVAGGLHLNSTILRSMLVLCPNIKHLDASYTNITDLSFKGLVFFLLKYNRKITEITHCLEIVNRLASKKACVHLEHLDLTGCRLVTDVGLERLGNCFKSKLSGSFYKCGSCQSCKSCPKYQAPLDNARYNSNGSLVEDEVFSPGLLYLSLSGCTSVTDFGLQSLLEVTLQKESLSYMDLSGCPMMSGQGLKMITEHSSRLQPEDLYYCNRIQEGPYPDEANGCQNLGCPIRGCCCFDQ